MTNRQILVVAIGFTAATLFAQTAPQATLGGTITDPSGASVPEAMVQLRGPRGEQRARTDVSGRYSLANLAPGKYLVRVLATGFTIAQRSDFPISGPTVLDVQLTIEATSQVVNVEDEANSLSLDAQSNAGALVLREKELAALSDDPDELSQQLQAMAGPSAGPNGGQIYVDGFTGGQMPPKSSIREVRINSNPYSPEYDRPGFGRIEILTKPGSDFIRGQVFVQYNKEALNSRSPLLTQSKRPPYQQKFFGVNLSGPIRRSKASFGLDFERRDITENAFVYATTLDDNLNPQSINQGVATPQVRTSFSPRLDYAINSANTLTLRYQGTRVNMEKEGIGDFSLPSRAYDQREREDTIQATETAVLSPRTINETRAQFLRTVTSLDGDNSVPALTVQGAFEGGGAQAGLSSMVVSRLEITNQTTVTAGAHIVKWGARVRQSFTDDTSLTNFGGAFTFFGGSGPQLDSANRPIEGTSIELSALERYRRTLLFQSLGYTGAEVRALGGGASQFTLSAGTPTTSLNQFDIGLFANDDWKVRPNLTLSYGFRYEAQTNLGDLANLSPRAGIAWGIDGGGGKQTRTVLRAGFGVFYSRLDESATLQALRYNGSTQQSYVVFDPDFYPAIPSTSTLAASLQPQRLHSVDSAYVAPRTYQTSVSLERQISRSFRLSAQYINSRGVHLSRTVNVNAPVNGAYPLGDNQIRLDTQSTGFSRTNQLVIAPNVNFKGIFLFGFYGLAYGKTDAEGTPADPHNLRAEWGPSSFADVRHRLLLGSSLPLPGRFTISPFFVVSSGSPYNITTGTDTNGDGFTAERPGLLTSVSSAQCAGGGLLYKAGFGCFDLNPAANATIGRNYGRGPANVTLNLRFARTWGFGNRGESGPDENGLPPGMGGVRGGGPPPGGGPGGPGGGPPPGGGPGGGPPRGLFGAASGKKYNITLSLSARNILNHTNYSAPSGDLSSPFFGEYRSLAGFGPFAGNTTYNRKIDVQLRFTF